MSIGDNIRILRESHGLTQAEFGRIAGVSDKAVSTWESDSRAPRMGAIQRLSEYFGIPKSQIIDGANAPVDPIPPGFSPLPETVRLPIVGQIACGTPITAEQNVEDYVEVPVSARATFVLRCRGDSMAPLIQDGDLVYIRKQPTVETAEIAAVRIGEEATLKRVYASPGQIILQPENHDYPPQVYAGIQLEEVVIEGKVVGIYRIMENR